MTRVNAEIEAHVMPFSAGGIFSPALSFFIFCLLIGVLSSTPDNFARVQSQLAVQLKIIFHFPLPPQCCFLWIFSGFLSFLFFF